MTKSSSTERGVFNLYMDSLNEFKFDFSLARIKKALSLLKNPQDRYGVFHVAGSNGKGSTAAFIEAGLRASGYRTGLYTSPHLLSVNERIAVNSKPVAAKLMESEGLKLAAFIKKQKIRLTYFEFLTVLAFVIFEKQQVQVAVIETGLGGRLDATNVGYAAKIISVITSISLEHTGYLGDTLDKILTEKEQIIGKGMCVFNVAASLKKRVKKKYGQRAIFADEKIPAEAEITGRGMVVKAKKYGRLKLAMPEPVQAKNVSAALCALETARSMDMAIDMKKAAAAMGQTAVPGRFTRHKKGYYLSVAHNPEAVQAAMETAGQLAPGKPVTYLFSILKDKDIDAVCRVIAAYPRVIPVITAINNERGLSVEKIRESMLKYGIKHYVEPDNKKAMRKARAICGKGIIVIGGSFYLVNKFI